MARDRTKPVTVTEEFTVTELRRVRSLVARAAKLVGLTMTAIDNLVTAVNEIAVNAIRYAGGKGRITIRSCARGISVEISDSGPGIPLGQGAGRPAAGATSGRGLWMARQLCQQMTVVNTGHGATVTLTVCPV